MKITAAILLTYISLISISPALSGFYNSVKKIELCCTSSSDEGCSSKKPKECNPSSKENEDDAPCTPCCGVPNCNCFCEKIPQLNFTVREILTENKIIVKDEKIFSSYLSDCWNPPELV